MSEQQKEKQLPVQKSLNIVNIQNFYLSELNKTITEYSEKLDEEQINCAQSMISAMSVKCADEGITIKEVDQSNVMTLLKQCVMLRLNCASVPAECYMIIRNHKQGNKWVKQFEFGVQGDGNDKIVRNYGYGVKKIYPYWIIREGDEFTYPSFKGVSMEPPTWTPKGGTGKYIRVVYPIEYEDGNIQYHIAEREDVSVNLKAHIINNIKMNKDIADAKKNEIKNKIADMSLDKMFEDKELLDIMSPAWRDSHSREMMILRKMRNNALKPIPREFKNVYAAQAYEETMEDRPQQETIDPESVIDAEVNENAGKTELKSLPEESSSEKVELNAETGEVIEKVAVKTKAPF